MKFILLNSVDFNQPFVISFCLLPAFINFYIFFYTIFRLPKNTTNNFFSFFVLLLALWQLADGCMHLCISETASLQWDRASDIPAIGVAVFEVLFALQFTGWSKKIPLLLYYLFLFVPAIMLIMYNVAGFDHYNVQRSEIWNWVSDPEASFYMKVFFIWLSLTSLLTSFLFFIYFLKAEKKSIKRKQSFLLFTGFTIPMIGGIIVEVIDPFLFDISSVPIVVPLITVFSVFSFIAIKRYRLLDYSPRHQWENILKTMNEGLLIIDNDSRIMYVNARLRDLTGFTDSELLNQHSSVILRNENKQLVYQEGPADEKPGAYVVIIKRKNGEKKWVMASSAPYIDETGNRIGSIVILSDITELIGIQNKLNDKVNELNLFFYKTSHDFKSPIASMIGLLDIHSPEDDVNELIQYMKICTGN